MPVTDVLRQAIVDSNYTINSLAHAAGLPQPVLSRFMNGVSRLNGESIDKLVEYLGMELVQQVSWTQYESELRADGTITDAWNEYQGDAWKEYEINAWKEFVAEAWRPHEEQAWKEYAQEAWADARENGGWEEDEYELWVQQEYADWSQDAYQEWCELEYSDWYDSVYESWYEGEYPKWEEAYLAKCRAELESRNYVQLDE